MTLAPFYQEGKTPSLNDRLASRAIRGAIMSADSLSKENGITSGGDDFCGSNQMTSATSSVVTCSMVDMVDVTLSPLRYARERHWLVFGRRYRCM